MKLKDRHVFVTGGADGIGAGIVLDAAQEGAEVSFCDINVEKGEAYARYLSKRGLKKFSIKPMLGFSRVWSVRTKRLLLSLVW